MSECVFCDLLAQGKLDLQYEDEQVVAFNDRDPKAPQHLLIIPRKHISSLNEIAASDEPVLGHLFSVAQQLAKKTGVDQSGYRTLVNTGDHAGQTVHHIHMHLLGGEPLKEI
jgi:histidine triad (HIT) family protein